MNAPEFLPQIFTEDGERVEIRISREVAEDALGVESVSLEEFDDWIDDNADLILRSARHKRDNAPHEHVEGVIILRPGELLP